jgi:RNA polymerase primary sigma factor
MESHSLPALRLLRDELARAPRAQLLMHLLQIDYALSVIEPGKKYSYDFVREVLLGRRLSSPTLVTDQLLDGKMLIEDLVTLADQLSHDAQFSPQTWREALSSPANVARRFNVSTKTVSRWRRRGLVGWRFGGSHAPTALLFPEHCLRQFVSRNPDLVRAAAGFSRLTADERQTIIARARELSAEGCRTGSAICSRIAAETARAPETVRQILNRHDHDSPHARILKRRSPEPPGAGWIDPRAGAAGDDLAPRPPEQPAWAHAAPTRVRAEELTERRIKFIDSPEFQAPDADRRILGPQPAGALRAPAIPDDGRICKGLPTYVARLRSVPLLSPELERFLFRKMNYLKYKAQLLVEKLDHANATPAAREAIDGLLERAARVKDEILEANLRLVVSIAKRRRRAGQDLSELISDGNLALMRAADNFDYQRGFKFSTYATWAIINSYARSTRTPRLRLQTNREKLGEVVDRHTDEEPSGDQLGLVRGAVDRMLAQLNPRDRAILSQRYGLGELSEPQSLAEIGRRLSLSKERIRQLQVRAMLRLRDEFQSDAGRLLRA